MMPNSRRNAPSLSRCDARRDTSGKARKAVGRVAIAAFLRYHHEQGLSKRRRAPEELVAPETLAEYFPTARRATEWTINGMYR
jgi:hypothetical protein